MRHPHAECAFPQCCFPYSAVRDRFRGFYGYLRYVPLGRICSFSVITIKQGGRYTLHRKGRLVIAFIVRSVMEYFVL